MWSVCLDILSMPPVEWEGDEFDCFLMCVDRLTGWMVARPSQKQGLTGKKAVHLLLDNSWGGGWYTWDYNFRPRIPIYITILGYHMFSVGS